MTARRVLITGASRGIGAAIAERFRVAGYEIVAPTRAELDLATPAAVQAWAAREVVDIDVLVNNAGENVVREIAEIELADWQRLVDVNLTTALLLTQACLRGMRGRRWGRVVNVSSMYSLLSRPGRAMYSATKSGLNGLTRAAALEGGPDGVLVNAVCPGFVETDMTRRNNSPAQIDALCAQVALRRLALPDEIARLVYFLGSDENSYITGQTVVIDGGFTIQ